MNKAGVTCLRAVFVAAFASAAPAHAHLIINATLDPSLSASAVSVINSAITFYQTTFTTPITVDIDFTRMNSGLGSSDTVVYSVPYSSYRTGLVNTATDANDAAALASLPNTPTNPVNGSPSVNLKSANARAVGFVTAVGGSFNGSGSPCPNSYFGDSCIGLNLAITNDTILGVPGGFSLISVVEHEIDEALALGSELPSTTFLGGDPMVQDLFRYASAGVRSFGANASCPGSAAYFSIDGGVTNLDSFNNCNNNADYGDWVTHSPAQVQDGFVSSGAPFLTLTSAETIGLDVLGYMIPEPASLGIMGFALAGLAFGRRRRGF